MMAGQRTVKPLAFFLDLSQSNTTSRSITPFSLMSCKLKLLFPFPFREGMMVAALLVSPCGMLAQRGSGSTGGGSAGGGGLSGGGGRATGLSVKDDLKDFHLALAVQATSQQVVAFESMMKSTDAADAELRAFMQQAAKQTSREETGPAPSDNTPVDQAIESAHTANKKFLEELSPQQKSGLKEILKQMTKADSELAQQIKNFDLEARDTKLIGPPIAASAQRLATALTTFRSRELDLGRNEHWEFQRRAGILRASAGEYLR
jgi:hypothetical protein